MVEMGFEKFVHDEIVDSDTFFTRRIIANTIATKSKNFSSSPGRLTPSCRSSSTFAWRAITSKGTHRLGDVKAPTLVLIGEADTVGSNHIAQSKVLVERIPGAKMKVLKGQSHGFFWQAAEETNPSFSTG